MKNCLTIQNLNPERPAASRLRLPALLALALLLLIGAGWLARTTATRQAVSPPVAAGDTPSAANEAQPPVSSTRGDAAATTSAAKQWVSSWQVAVASWLLSWLGLLLLLHALRTEAGGLDTPMYFGFGLVILASSVLLRFWVRLWLIALVIGCLAVCATASAASPPDGSGLGFLAQVAGGSEPSLERVTTFLTRLMILVGGVMIFAGGWRIHRGETTEGLLAIAGGFVVAIAFPIINYFAQ